MKHVPVPPPRSTFTETPDGVELVIPARRSWLVIGFAVLFLIPWTIVPTAFVWQHFNQGAIEPAAERPTSTFADRRSNRADDEPIPTAIVVLLPTVALLLVAAFGLVVGWQLVGRLRVSIDADSLVLRRHIGPLGFTRAYDRAQVRGLRAVAAPPWNMFPINIHLPFGQPKLAFDYGSKTVRFANDLDEAEARSIVRLLGERGLHARRTFMSEDR